MHKSTDIGQLPLPLAAPLYIGLFPLTQRWTAEKEGGTGLTTKHDYKKMKANAC